MARRKVRNRGKLEVSPKRRKANKIQQNWFEINEILRKAEMVSTGGQSKFLVSWPETWEPKENLSKCPELLRAFELGLSQDFDTDNNDDDKDIFSTEWMVKKILAKRYVRAKPQYLLRWENSWVDAKHIPPKLINDFEQKMKEQQFDSMDMNNNQNEKEENSKRKRSTNADDDESIPKKISKYEESDDTKSKRVVNVTLSSFTEKRQINKIVNIGISDDRQFTFLLKFKTGEYGVMKRDVANIKYPQEVIAFYQKRVRFD